MYIDLAKLSRILMYMEDTGRNPSQPRPTRDPSLLSSKGGIDDRDSSWPLYALYSKIAQGEDNNDAERRQKDADGILVFVSPRVTSPLLSHQLENLDRFILRHCRGIACGHNPRPQGHRV
jgi:hypothetical protein